MDRKETQFNELDVWDPHEKKLNFRTTINYFMRYLEKFKGYKFYCLNYSTRIVKSKSVRFIENGDISGND